MTEESDESLYVVVRNDEEQYSIWPSFRDAPAGWTVLTAPAAREDCLAYVEEHWTDMRPRSLREALAPQGQSGSVH
jgi:MbtH protein